MIEQKSNSIFFRVDDGIYTKLNRIKDTYGFRSNAELARTIVRVFVNLYGRKRTVKEDIDDEIMSEFKQLENGEKMFDFLKPKKRKTQKDIEELE